MKIFILQRKWFLTFLLLFIAVNVVIAQGGEHPPASAVNFPLSLLIAYVIGVLISYLNKYQQGHVEGSFGKYLWNNLAATIITTLMGLSTFIGTYALNPDAYRPSNAASWIIVILLGVGIDSFNREKKAV